MENMERMATMASVSEKYCLSYTFSNTFITGRPNYTVSQKRYHSNHSYNFVNS